MLTSILLETQGSGAVTSEMMDALSTAFSNVSDGVLGVVKIALPVGLGIFAAIFGIKKGIAFFRSIASKN